MIFNTSIGKNNSRLYQQNRWWEHFCLLLLVVAASILYTIDLGNLPLDELQESTITKIAEKISLIPFTPKAWLFPGISDIYSDWQAPLLPNIIAIFYKIGGSSSLTSRFPCALLGAFSTVILYKLGRELFKGTLPVLLSCCVYVTFFPAIYGGRLATVNAPVLFFEMFALWAFLRSRRDLRWTLVGGFGLSLVGLTDIKSLFPLFVVILSFLIWDTPRLLKSRHFYLGSILGLLPLILWCLAHWHYLDWHHLDFSLTLSSYKSPIAFTIPELSSQQYNRLYRYLSRAFFYCSPWLIVYAYGLRLAWYYRNWGWAKFVLVASSSCAVFWLLKILFYLLAIDFVSLNYVLPIYPVLALAAGMQLYQLRNLPSYIAYPLTWNSVFNCSALVIFLLGLYCKFAIDVNFDWLLGGIFVSLILTFKVAASLLARRDIQFIAILIWGSYISLLLFFCYKYSV